MDLEQKEAFASEQFKQLVGKRDRAKLAHGHALRASDPIEMPRSRQAWDMASRALALFVAPWDRRKSRAGSSGRGTGPEKASQASPSAGCRP